MRGFYLFIVFFEICVVSKAQQRPHYSQYLQNQFLLNPALSGIESYADMRVGNRWQWAGIKNAPRTFYVTGHLPIGNPDFKIEQASARFSQRRNWESEMPVSHGGAGFSAVADQSGAMSRMSFNASGAFHYPIGYNWQLSAGIAGGVTQYSLDFDQIKFADPQDPVLQQGQATTYSPDFHAGLWVYSPYFYAGISAQQMLNSKIKFSPNSEENRAVPHYFATIGGNLDIADDWTFVPSLMLQESNNQPLTGDVNLKFSYRNDASLGLSYRLKNSFLVWASGRFASKFMMSYGYELVLSGLDNITSGSHELTLGMTLGNRTHYASPRMFW